MFKVQTPDFELFEKVGTLDFVFFEKVVYLQCLNTEFRTFSRKTKSGFEKKSGFRFSRNVSSENFKKKKIVQEHGAIVPSISAGLFRVHETERMAEMDSAF